MESELVRKGDFVLVNGEHGLVTASPTMAGYDGGMQVRVLLLDGREHMVPVDRLKVQRHAT